MQLWMILQFALALVTAISCIALVIGKLHMIERAETQQWLKDLKDSIPVLH